MIRWSRLGGLYTLFFSCLAVVACDDSEDRSESSGATSNDEAGKSAGGTADGGKAGTGQGAAGSNAVAGTGLGESGGGGGGTAGTGGIAGSGGVASCATNCNDDNPCTNDACEQDVCVHRDNTAACDDGNACTSDDTCSRGSCKGANNTEACDDGNACTSSDACANGACYGTSNTDTCDDGNECTSSDACLDGACQGTNNTAVCDDRSSCTTGDACWNGDCLGATNLNLCPVCNVAGNLIQNCDFNDGQEHWLPGFFDGGAGTQDVLSERLVVGITEGAGANYAIQPRQEPLSLKQGVKYRLRLVAGASVARPFVISLTLATTPYTIFTPGDTLSGYTVNATTEMKPFEFDFIVTEPDNDNVKLEIKLGGPGTSGTTVYLDDVYLAELKCTANPDCDDGNECTDDVCNVTEGTCTSTNRSGACTADINPCTADLCLDGSCSHPALADDEPCTSDGDVCTADACTGGVCSHDYDTMVCDCQTNQHCDDHNPCTDDVCTAGDCSATNNTDECEDGDVCTVADACSAGVCAPTMNVCFDCTLGGNLLTNCNFSNGLTGWATDLFFNGAAGTQTVQNGMLTLNISNGGEMVWQVQPRQEGLMLAMGTTYVVRFNAMATIERPMIVSLTQNADPFTSYSCVQPGCLPRTFDLTTEMKEHSFEFTMEAAPPAANVKLEIDLGGTAQNPSAPNTVYLDNISIAPKP